MNAEPILHRFAADAAQPAQGPADAAAAPEPLFALLSRRIPGLARHLARKAIIAGLVHVAGSAVHNPNQPVPPGSTVTCDLRQGVRSPWLRQRHGSPAADAPRFTVLHADARLLIVDKAAGVLSVPARAGAPGDPPERGHLPELIRRTWRKQGKKLAYLGVVHRLDRDTSGCICFALDREAQRLLAAQFAGEAAERTYRCLVVGQPARDAGVVAGRQGRDERGRRALVDDDEAGKDVETRWTVLRRFPRGAELEIRLGTGRTHQVRVAMAALGCPVLGDRIYGQRAARGAKPASNTRRQEPAPSAARLMLHAVRLDLDHPGTGQRLSATAALPETFAEGVRQLGGR